MWLPCIDLCIGGCVSSRDLARTLPLHLATSQTGSDGPPTVSTSPSSSCVCTELQLSLRHMPTGHPLPPALSMSLPCIFSECLSTSDIAPCFGALFSTLLSKSRLSCIRWCLLHCHQDSEARVILSTDLFGGIFLLGLSSAAVNGPLLPDQRHLIAQRPELAPQEYPGTALSLSQSQTRTCIQWLGLLICCWPRAPSCGHFVAPQSEEDEEVV